MISSCTAISVHPPPLGVGFFGVGGGGGFFLPPFSPESLGLQQTPWLQDFLNSLETS